MESGFNGVVEPMGEDPIIFSSEKSSSPTNLEPISKPTLQPYSSSASIVEPSFETILESETTVEATTESSSEGFK